METTTSQAVAAELRAVAARRAASYGYIAGRLSVTPMWLSRRLRGVVALSVDDVAAICGVLQVTPLEIYAAAEAAAEPTEVSA